MAEVGYSVEGLENGIENARRNIRVLEEAIERERQNIKEWRVMIDDIERAEREIKSAMENLHVEVVR